MDIAIQKKRLPDVKRYVTYALLTAVAVFALHYLWQLSRAGLSIDKEALVISEVKRGDFTVSVRGTGVLVPDNIQLLSADVEATVERLIVKAGKVVKKGDLIVELVNPQLTQLLAETQWELEAMDAEIIASTVAQESSLLEQEALVQDAKLNFEASELELNAQIKLLETDAVSKLDYQRTRLQTEQLKQRWLTSQEQLGKARENLLAQNNARSARLNKAKKTLERIQKQVDDLKVRATMDSIVLDMPLEVGERVAMGANIAKLAQQDSLIAELQVPENQIREVTAGMRVIIDTRNNTIEGFVTRIDPAVVNGNVQVDVEFPGVLPDDARPDLSVDGEIKIAEIQNTLFVDRPLFSQSKTNGFVYRVSRDGSYAERSQVKLGLGSVNKIQVVEGLNAGDMIVTSDPTRFEIYNKFRIN